MHFFNFFCIYLHLQLFECVKFAVDDIVEVLSGKFITNRPSPPSGSFLSGSRALALFSGGSVKSARNLIE